MANRVSHGKCRRKFTTLLVDYVKVYNISYIAVHSVNQFRLFCKSQLELHYFDYSTPQIQRFVAYVVQICVDRVVANCEIVMEKSWNLIQQILWNLM